MADGNAEAAVGNCSTVIHTIEVFFNISIGNGPAEQLIKVPEIKEGEPPLEGNSPFYRYSLL